VRRAAKVDANQRVIVEALRRVGASVIDLSAVGDGCPDLLVGYRGHTWLIEVKGPKGSLTPAQKVLHAEWNGFPIAVVKTVEEAWLLIGAIR
jgi:Holliday junction resolvase